MWFLKCMEKEKETRLNQVVRTIEFGYIKSCAIKNTSKDVKYKKKENFQWKNKCNQTHH